MHYLALIFCLLTFPVAADTLSITDGETGDKYPGKFVWTDLVSSDPAEAADFYSQLFGWQVTPYDEDYLVIRNHGRPIGGITRNQDQSGEDGNQWISYISTSDLAESHEQLVSSGAVVVLEPVTVRQRGEFSIYVAPDGAMFGVIDAEDGDPREQGADIGDWIWIELWSKDVNRAVSFYQQLGYSIETNWASDNAEDKLLVAGEYARGGIVQGHPEQTRSGWLLYVRVQDVEETVALAKSLGGEAASLEGEANTTGDIAFIQDPTGGVVAVYRYVEPQGEAAE